jgi:predicted alpha-1,2-mannosidase
MRRLCALLIPAALFVSASLAAKPEDLTRFADPLIGTGGHGHTYPGATVPFGMVQLSPDTGNKGWDWCSGYHYSDSTIMGFSHTHLSGTGIGDMADFLLMPGTGPVRTAPGAADKPGEGYRSRFSHSDEAAEPGYYSVLLRDYGIKAELSATERAGIHKYTFPESGSSHFILDLTHVISGSANSIISSELSIRNNDTVLGGRRTSLWAKGRHMYFAMKFSKPFAHSRILLSDEALADSVREASGKSLKFVAEYRTSPGEVIYVKVGISGVSAEGALKNLDAEIPGWDFAGVRRRAHEAWQRELSKLAIETTDAKSRRIFYTALYHTMLAPTLFDDVDGQYRGMDLKVHQAPEGQHNYSTFSLWDTYRALHPLYTLMAPGRVPELLNCLIRMGEESPAGSPVWPLMGVETGTMTGYHSVVVLAEAMAKGFHGIDYERAYAVMRKRALEDDYRGLGLYRKLGYIPSDREAESATKTLEYSYDDWAMARLAKGLGKAEDEKMFLARAMNYRNLWDKSTGFIRPRLESGAWAEPFDPKQTGTTRKWRDFTESNSWQATWAAQHDPAGYIELLGGRDAVVKKLDALFTQSPEINGEVPADMTGLVGMYAHGNEPSHHIAYLYAYAGAAYKTQERVRDLLDRMYNDKPDGLAGNEDCGQMSAWYVMSALGFYPVDPVSGNYVFGAPLFDKAVVDLGGGHKLTLRAKRHSPGDKYIQSITFNGKPYSKVWFSHAAIGGGGTIVFQMGAHPNPQFGSEQGAEPPSMSR